VKEKNGNNDDNNPVMGLLLFVGWFLLILTAVWLMCQLVEAIELYLGYPIP